MEFILFTKPSFTVIGMEGSTDDGAGFVQRLWDEANARFGEIAPLAKRASDGAPLAVWGAMTDFSRAFLPWEDSFSRGLYLAGAECADGAEAPDGWTKWIVPQFEFLRIENDGPDAFALGLILLERQKLTLSGAVQELTVPSEGKCYLCYPVSRG